MSGSRCFLTRTLRTAAWLGSVMLACGQTNSIQTPDSAESLRAQMQQFRLALQDLRDQLAGSRRESDELRREVQALRQQLNVLASAAPTARPGEPQPDASGDVSALSDEQRLMRAKVDEQYQTKVSSGSKYRVRLSGLALFNVFSTRGEVDNIDLPGIAQRKGAQDSGGSFGGTLRQSQVSLEVFGPDLGGAKTSGDLKFDFFGGFPSTAEGVTSGIVRLRTAKLALDWKNTSIVAGQEAPFFSPLSPTSLASTAYPALSSSGNLWTWTPQIYAEHRIVFSDNDTLSLQWGLLDALTGELPVTEYNRTATAGERSRVPAYATRLAWRRASEQVATLGAGAYYSRQDWGFHRTVDAWAATADWELPLGRWFSLSGELYRGRAIGGLGGGASGSVLFSGSSVMASSSVLALNSAGGWSQLKFKPLPKVEFNAAIGLDHAFHSGLSRFVAGTKGNDSMIRRNASGFVNVIYQARSNLLLSVEYRRLWTYRLLEPRSTADHVNLGAGIIF